MASREGTGHLGGLLHSWRKWDGSGQSPEEKAGPGLQSPERFSAVLFSSSTTTEKLPSFLDLAISPRVWATTLGGTRGLDQQGLPRTGSTRTARPLCALSPGATAPRQAPAVLIGEPREKAVSLSEKGGGRGIPVSASTSDPLFPPPCPPRDLLRCWRRVTQPPSLLPSVLGRKSAVEVLPPLLLLRFLLGPRQRWDSWVPEGNAFGSSRRRWALGRRGGSWPQQSQKKESVRSRPPPAPCLSQGAGPGELALAYGDTRVLSPGYMK